MSLSFEEQTNVFNVLRLQNCCLRCCFRFSGWRTPDCYQNPIEFAKRLKYVSPECDAIDERTCAACLGILQEKTQHEVIQKIVSEVERQNYDCSTFTCALTVPVAVPLRERLLHTYCATELSLSENDLCNLKIKIQNIKDVWKWVVIPKLEKAMNKRAELATPSAFLIEIFLAYKYDDVECQEFLALFKGSNNSCGKKKRKSNDNRFSRKNMETFMAGITDEQFSKSFNASVIKTIESVSVENVVCSHSSIFIGGRYNKLSREISQTPWFINGQKKMETSVQDIISNPIVEAVRAESIKFLSSGREDVDVRNIYSGRPFAVELINPRMTEITKELLSSLINKINQSSKQVQITSDLRVLSKLDLKTLKEGENIKTKFYRAICVCRNAPTNTLQLNDLNALKCVQIVQKTPVRVLHRRPLSPRIRLIYEMRARWAKPHELKRLLNTAAEDAGRFFVLDIKTQAGTYVKEFIHGDFGRTKPSLCNLLKTEVDIIALDVTGINLNWP